MKARSGRALNDGLVEPVQVRQSPEDEAAASQDRHIAGMVGWGRVDELDRAVGVRRAVKVVNPNTLYKIKVSGLIVYGKAQIIE